MYVMAPVSLLSDPDGLMQIRQPDWLRLLSGRQPLVRLRRHLQESAHTVTTRLH